MEPRFLTAQQFLITTLVFKIAIMALLATMLVRYRRFRHILIFERRGILDRGMLAFSLGIPLIAGVAARILLRYDAADLTLEGSFLVGLIAGPYAGAMVGALTAVPALIARNGARCPSPSAAGLPAAGCASCARKKPSGTSRRLSSRRCPAASGTWSAASRWTGSSSWCWRPSRSS